ncbi:ParB/RepB/Spo0J family partition protein [Streptomyces sp. P1-3]|uniref:ParB/RepB/Spo0J family partition protein n=1 Tax=Streptomyces sp. P1-3 TaxID=3421658 RepID=UPI003D36D49D
MQLHALRSAVSPRLAGEDDQHVRALARLDIPLPPIVVHRATLRVIDGMHRLRAAELRGDTDIEVRFVDGSEADAFVLSVKLNKAHGLPLSHADRSLAAARIIASHPHWSDRKIAKVTDLAASSVGAIRKRSTEQIDQSNGRLGMDGRVRPLDIAERRRLASRLFSEQPQISLRAVAKTAGISLSTAHDVRVRLRAGNDPLPTRQRERLARSPAGRLAACEQPTAATGGAAEPASADLLERLRKDPSLRFNEMCRYLLQWLGATTIADEGPERFVRCVPPHRAQAVARAARACAESWVQLAEALEGHAKSSRRHG